MSYMLLYLQALARWALEWAQMYLALTRIWISAHTLETVIALLLVALFFAALGRLAPGEYQEG